MTVPSRDETARPWSAQTNHRGATGAHGPGDSHHNHQGIGHEHKATDGSLVVPGHAGMPGRFGMDGISNSRSYENEGSTRGPAGNYQMISRLPRPLLSLDHNATEAHGNRPDDPHAPNQEAQLGGGAAGQNWYFEHANIADYSHHGEDAERMRAAEQSPYDNEPDPDEFYDDY